MKIIEIAFTVYPVTDMKRARAFYEGTLGLVAARTYGDESQGWVEYDIGPGTLALGCGAEAFQPSKGGGAVGLEVDNFEEAITRLKAAQAQFIVEPMDTPVCKMAALADPDGNSLLIHKRKG